MTEIEGSGSEAPVRQTKPRVAVLFGGRSSEHSISCVTAVGVLGAIDRQKYDVVPVGVTKDGRWVLAGDETLSWALDSGILPEVDGSAKTVSLVGRSSAGRLGAAGGTAELLSSAPGEVPGVLGDVDVVFPLFHGPFGEDGTIQGMLELIDVRYVGAGVLASAVGMDKEIMKIIFISAGLQVGPYRVVNDADWRHRRAEIQPRIAELGWPVFVKPARAGSSVGISKVDGPEGLLAAIELARQHDPKVIVEAAVLGREIECAVLQGRDGSPPRTSLPGEVVTGGSHDFYDFEAKYLDEGAAVIKCPAELPAAVIDRIRQEAARAFEAINAEGLSRVDFFYTVDGDVVINEINTLPGFTPKSMYPQMWAASGLSYPELVDELLQLALARNTGLR